MQTMTSFCDGIWTRSCHHVNDWRNEGILDLQVHSISLQLLQCKTTKKEIYYIGICLSCNPMHFSVNCFKWFALKLSWYNLHLSVANYQSSLSEHKCMKTAASLIIIPPFLLRLNLLLFTPSSSRLLRAKWLFQNNSSLIIII